jgi:N-acetylglucosaminyl-diphospho-decaprenol L-rhamnosyltransferase
MPLATKKKPGRASETIAATVEPEPQPEAAEQPPAVKVTALIFSYNNAAGLRRCLTALDNSKDRQQIEVLVVDSGSSDESPTMDSEFPNITILRLPRYFGWTKALNIGTRTAAAELLFCLTPEVEVMPDTIPSLLARLESDPEAIAVCPLLLDTNRVPPRQFFRLPVPATGEKIEPGEIDISAESVAVEYATFRALLVRKYFVRGINYLDERYGDFGADAELCYQIRRASRKILALPQVTALFTPGPPRFAGARAITAADRTHGTAVYFGKHYGFLRGLLFRLGAIVKALVTLRLSLFMLLASFSKIDGSQTAVL